MSNKNSFSVIYRLNNSHIEQLTELYQKEWWTKGRTSDQTKLLITSSTVVIGIVNENNQIIAFTRILSDKVIKAIIFDVIVQNDCRGYGLGNQLMDLVFNHYELKSVKHFELYCLDEITAFYNRFGFKSLNDEMNYLRRVNKH